MNNVKSVDVKKHFFGSFKLEELMNKVQYNLSVLNVGINGKMIDELLIVIYILLNYLKLLIKNNQQHSSYIYLYNQFNEYLFIINFKLYSILEHLLTNQKIF